MICRGAEPGEGCLARDQELGADATQANGGVGGNGAVLGYAVYHARPVQRDRLPADAIASRMHAPDAMQKMHSRLLLPELRRRQRFILKRLPEQCICASHRSSTHLQCNGAAAALSKHST